MLKSKANLINTCITEMRFVQYNILIIISKTEWKKKGKKSEYCF